MAPAMPARVSGCLPPLRAVKASMAMVIEDGGTVETAAKTIPILLQTLDLAIYPEGGDLIAGLPNRVYVQGRTPSQKPADMAGVILNAAGKEVAAFRTEHEGRGRFSFVPSKGDSYSLHITEPAGIKTMFRAPGGQRVRCGYFLAVRHHCQRKGHQGSRGRHLGGFLPRRVEPARERIRIQTDHAAGESSRMT